MKMLIVFCSAPSLERVQRLIDDHEVHGYTEIPDLPGSGETGRHMGSRAWPGTTSIVLTAVSDEKAGELVTSLQQLSRECAPGEGVRVLLLPVERFV